MNSLCLLVQVWLLHAALLVIRACSLEFVDFSYLQIIANVGYVYLFNTLFFLLVEISGLHVASNINYTLMHVNLI